MTAPTPFPDPADKAAVRRWMRENQRSGVGRAAPITPEEFAANQRRRLLNRLHLPDEMVPRRRLDVALTGESTAEHSVRISVLGQFLTELQDSVSAVAQAQTGRLTNSAPIPRRIRDATVLRAAAMYPSSFGVALYGSEYDAVQDSLFPELTGNAQTILDDAMRAVLDIVDLSEGVGPSGDLLIEQLLPLGPRAITHLTTLTRGLSDAGVGLRIVWRVPGTAARHSEWSQLGVERVHDLCAHVEFDEAETTTIVGWLLAASKLRGVVEIRTDSGAIVHATTDEDLTSRLVDHFDQRVEAEVEVTNVRSTGGRERRLYSVLALRNL